MISKNSISRQPSKQISNICRCKYTLRHTVYNFLHTLKTDALLLFYTCSRISELLNFTVINMIDMDNNTEIEQITNRLKYFLEADRLASFVWWPYDSSKKCNVQKLAEAGFFYIQSEDVSDNVMCFYCGKCLDSWEEDDDPWAEHIKHSSKNHCKFAHLRKPQVELTLQQFFHLKRDFGQKIMNECFDSFEETSEKLDDNLKKTHILKQKKLVKKH